jgi:hypothetical protein
VDELMDQGQITPARFAALVALPLEDAGGCVGSVCAEVGAVSRATPLIRLHSVLCPSVCPRC